MSTAGCKMFGAVTPCTQTDKTYADGSDDILLEVPKKFAQFPLGFALDAGGSVAKIVYRSKFDYTGGQPNSGKDVLRLRFFPKDKEDDLIAFLKGNCDLRVMTQGGTGDNDKHPLYYLTGVGIQHYVRKLEQAFQCKIIAMPEHDALVNAMVKVSKIIPLLKKNVPFSVESTTTALDRCREMIQVMKDYKDAGVNAFGDIATPQTDAAQQAFVGRLFMTDPVSLADELTNKPITFPCAVFVCGSATVAFIVNENGQRMEVDFNPTAGRTLLALGRLLLGVQSFDEIVELASKGDPRKVDLLTGDLKCKSRRDVDWYSLMPESHVVFMLGRLAEEKYDGSYTKADIAAALINMQCDRLCLLAGNVSRIHNVSSVLFEGSFVQWPYVQQALYMRTIGDNLLLPLIRGSSYNAHIVPNSGFLTAIGAWYENIKDTVGEQ